MLEASGSREFRNQPHESALRMEILNSSEYKAATAHLNESELSDSVKTDFSNEIESIVAVGESLE